MTYEAKPKFDQVRHYLSKAIRTGRFEPGQRLPSERALATELGVTHLTVRRGLEDLVDQGLVTKQPRVGTFVAEDALDPDKRMQTFAMVCRDYYFDSYGEHPTLAAYLAGAQRFCRPPDYAMQILSYREKRFREDAGDVLNRLNVDGVLVIGGEMRDVDLRFLHDRRIPSVVCGIDERLPEDTWSVRLSYQTENALEQALDHLVALGHRRIALAYWTITPHRRSLSEAFLEMMLHRGLGDSGKLQVPLRNPTCHMHMEDIDALFDIVPSPTAVIINDEYMADALLARCDQRGIHVPEDLSVVTQFDARPYGRRVKLTSVYRTRDLSRVSYFACRLLSRINKGYAVPRRHIWITGRLKPGNSTQAMHGSSVTETTA